MGSENDRFDRGAPAYLPGDPPGQYASSLTPPPQRSPVQPVYGSVSGLGMPADASASSRQNLGKRNVFAMLAFWLSIFALVPFGLFFAAVALTQIRQDPQRGRGFAIAAVVISFSWMIIVPIMLMLVMILHA